MDNLNGVETLQEALTYQVFPQSIHSFFLRMIIDIFISLSCRKARFLLEIM
jgi:hypothetical protein